MTTIQQQLKNASVNGCIPIDRALQVAAVADQQREETIALLRECERNVGMYLGEKINAHLSVLEGTKFSAVDYHYEIPNGEQ
ncbi:MAG: hypothetical protein ABIN91_11140 [Mucilaginibacter sp.]|uniref:hypothetical protein n=1 Tax=Mucilaginibacter sp. TaxID=1882438 RepID=UPI0032671749